MRLTSATRTLAAAALVTVITAPAQADGVRHVEGAWPAAIVTTFEPGTTPNAPATTWTIAPAWPATASWWRYSSRSNAWTRVWPPASAASDSVVVIEAGDVHHEHLAPGAHLVVLRPAAGVVDAEVLWR